MSGEATGTPLSVVMTVHDGERYLAAAIESILEQTFRDFEFLIFDNGSRDGSREIAERYADGDARITVHAGGRDRRQIFPGLSCAGRVQSGRVRSRR